MNNLPVVAKDTLIPHWLFTKSIEDIAATMSSWGAVDIAYGKYSEDWKCQLHMMSEGTSIFVDSGDHLTLRAAISICYLRAIVAQHLPTSVDPSIVEGEALIDTSNQGESDGIAQAMLDGDMADDGEWIGPTTEDESDKPPDGIAEGSSIPQPVPGAKQVTHPDDDEVPF